MDEQQPVRLINDPSREAVSSLRGYAYQIWHSLLAWLELAEGEILFLEGAEDFDLLRGDEAVTAQIRLHARPITLNNQPIRDALENYWKHSTRNPDRIVRYRYITPASIGPEQADDFGFGRPGLELWRESQRVEDREQWQPLVAALRDHMLHDVAICRDILNFLENATVDEVRDRLILPVVWEVNAPTQDDLTLLVGRAVMLLGRTQQLTAPQSRMAIPELLQRVFEKASARNDRWLDRDDLLEAFETATSIPIRVNNLALLRGATDVERADAIQEGILDPLPLLPPRFYHRASVYTQMQDRLARGKVVLVGSSGVGKTAAAVDFAIRSGESWAYIDLRGRSASEADHALRVAIQTFPTTEAVSLVIDDLPNVGDVRRFESALSRICDLIVGNAQSVVITSYLAPAPSLVQAMRLEADAVYTMPMFDEEEIERFLIESGATEACAHGWRTPMLAMTGGHPTLVDARVLALEARGFPTVTIDDIFEQPQEVLDIHDQARRYIATIDEQQRILLYRTSIATHPLRREHLAALGGATLPGEGRVARPGEVIDQLTGPWLERAVEERYRISPLAFGSGPLANDQAWTLAAHRALARALMSLEVTDVRDAALAVIHSVSGEDGELLGRILEAFLQNSNEEIWTTIAHFMPLFSAIAIGTAPLEALRNAAILTMLRCAQYRVARAQNDRADAARIVAAFNAEIPNDDFHVPLRFMFYSVACVYSIEQMGSHVEHILEWIGIVARAAESDNELAREMAETLRSLSGTAGNVADSAGVLLFGKIAATNDLEIMTERLEREEADVSRGLLTWIEGEPVVWRGVVANMIVDERDAEEPDFLHLAEALEHFETFCHNVGARTLALEAAASGIRVLAEFADDTIAARARLEAAKGRYGDAPRLKLVEAVISHSAGDARGALGMFQEAIAAIDYATDDIEPALDLRLAAMDAGGVNDFDLASQLLEAAASHATLAATPFLRLGACRGFALSLWYNTSMSGHFVSSDRDTPMLMSPSLQDWLPDNHLARLIVETVERLDLRAIEDSYTGRGERAYRPKMLVALLLYGYATGVFSSRKLERSCFDSVAFRFIAANTSPDHDTINDFRKRILPDLPGIFLQVLLVAKELGVLTVGQISLDGSKIKANASKHRALSYGYTGKLKARLRREIVRLMKLAEAAESERDPQIDIPAEIARRETLITKIDEARAKIEEREALRHAEVRAKHAERLAQRKEQQRQGKKPRGPRPRLPKLRVEPTAQVNLTDEESRIMPTADSFVQGYNAQAGVSIGSQFVIYAEVTQDTNDKQQLVPAVIGLQALPEILGACSDVVADAGYYSEANALACEAAGVTPYLSMSRQKHHGWLDAQLRKPDSEPSADASPAERMAFRLQTPDGRELYAKRKSTVEPVFGIAKSAMGFRTFLLRGLEKVGGEWKLVCTAYNLKHLHALVAACPVARAPA